MTDTAEEFLQGFWDAVADALAAALPPAAPTPRRVRLAAHVGQAGWTLGYAVAQAGRRIARAGDRIIDGGDWLAARVAGRR